MNNADTAKSNLETLSPEEIVRRRRKGRLTLLGLAVVFLSPMLFALLWQTEGRVNHGTLIQPPRPLPAVTLNLADGATISTEELRRKWLWTTVVTGRCEAVCIENLYTLRQARLALGKKTKRVNYALLIVDPEADAISDELLAEHPVLTVYRISGADAKTLQSGFVAANPDGTGSEIFVIDPLGNIMMQYDTGTDPRALKKDINRLLMASHVG